MGPSLPPRVYTPNEPALPPRAYNPTTIQRDQPRAAAPATPATPASGADPVYDTKLPDLFMNGHKAGAGNWRCATLYPHTPPPPTHAPLLTHPHPSPLTLYHRHPSPLTHSLRSPYGRRSPVVEDAVSRRKKKTKNARTLRPMRR